MTKIIGFAGKKQSGKNVSCNYIMALQLQEANVCKQTALSPEGDILVSDIFGEKIKGMPWVPLTKDYVNVDGLFYDFQECKIYALAEPLKQIAIDLLGLPEDKVYGTDEDKNEPTHLRWENMPGIITNELVYDQLIEAFSDVTPNAQALINAELGIYHKAGYMTIREVLQYLGTDILRKIYPKIWVDTLIRRIKKEKPNYALICDVRFDNEIIELQKAGGHIIGLLRNSDSKDSHASEKIRFDLCNKVIDNINMNIQEQCEKINQILPQIA